MKSTLVIGSGSAIAEAICHQLNEIENERVLSVSRLEAFKYSSDHLQLDLQKPDSVSLLEKWLLRVGLPDRVIHCVGILHDENYQPEKQLNQITDEWFLKSVSINILTHVHAAQAINRLLTSKKSIQWASLSAMVGSITDNQLGGWYSYRMTKAALNMFIHNLGIEWRRKNKNNRVVAIHPGTTDSPLSKPFQGGVARGKLYSSEQTATRILAMMNALKEEQSGKLLHWDGSVLCW